VRPGRRVIDVRIEVAIAWRDRQRVVELVLPEDSTVADALRRVAELAEFSRVDLNVAPVGIYGHLVDRSQRLIEGDRVEVYRSLAIDPMTARRRRAGRVVNPRAAD
jgi:putative ubiquitin-RnfH superfamily antitoxin RatB of RatAB toxin-antitoxin module